MVNVDIFGILFDFFDVLVDFTTNAYNFLFQEINILGYEFQPFYLLGGTLFAVFMIAWLIRRFI